MYLFDPARGRSRRDRLMAEASALFHRDERRLAKHGKALVNRMRGIAAETAAAFAPEEPVADEVLVERVRSRMGHLIPNPHEIQVHARDGVVTLEGKLAHSARRRLRHEVEAIPGVQGVDDRLLDRFALTPGFLVGLAAGFSLLGKLARAKTS